MEGPTVEEPLYQVREHCSPYEPLRWLNTVFSTLQDVDIDG